MSADGIESPYPMRLRVQLVREGEGPTPTVGNPAESARILGPISRAHWDDGREWFGILCLDARHRLIGLHVVSVGCLTSSLVHPREVFGPAIVAKAAALVLFHNHPSNDPEPSAEDLALTRRLAAAGALLGIEVLDHTVIASDGSRWVSLKERGIL